MADRSGGVIRMVTKSSFDSLARVFQNTSFADEDVSTVDLKKFSKKECSTFVPASEGSQQRCGCGHLRTDHQPDILCATNEVWSSDRHTSQMPTDCFGSLSFSEKEQDQQISSEYVRISDKTSPEMVWSLLTEIWNLKPPTLVLSLLGGNGSDTLNSKIKLSLEEGLPKLLKAMKVWILTNGTDTDCTKLISSSLLLHKYFKKRIEQKIACIGITSWGCTGWTKQLLGESNTVVYKPENEGETVKKNLCPNHTHFLLIDDGSVNRFGSEQKIRTSLDFFLSLNGIPLVSLLIGGEFMACVHLMENIRGNKRIHIVVIKGSGGLADVLEASLDLHDKMEHGSSRLQRYIRQKVEEHIKGSNEEEKINEVVHAVMEIIEQHKTQIVIFDPSGQSYGVHHAILEAARASSKGSEQHDLLNRLQLAIHMNEIEIADRDLQHGLADDELVTTTLYRALKSGKSNFVQFFLKNGVDLKSFIGEDKRMLKKLYFKAIKKGSFLCKLMSYASKKMPSTHETFDLSIIDQLLDCFMEEDYYSKIEEPHSMTPCQELMIWAIFNDMFDMVECFWKHETRRSLENALVIYRLYRSMSKKLRNVDEIKRHTLRSQANTFEKRAVELLTLCYEEAPESATEAIATRMPLWGNQRLISLAANGRSRNFVSHNCCQAYLKEIWHGMRGINERWKKHDSWKRQTSEIGLLDETDRGAEGGKCPSLFKKIFAFLKFLLFAPKGKAVLHMVMYLIFLGCFMYKLLIEDKNSYSALWVYVNVFVAAVMIEKICEILSMQKKTILMKAREWWHSMWKKIDVLSILLFYISIGMAVKFENGSRAVRAAALVAWIIKFSQFYRMIHSLGPYLTMVYRMLLHMSTFIWVLLTVVIAFGIFLYSFLYSAEKLSWMIIFKLLFRPYLLVFGELGISTYSIGKTQTVFGTTKLDTARELIAVFGMCVYILIANVLLLNVLIAVFNNIYEDIKENSDKIWKFDRYHVIVEYSNKPSLPPPFSIVSTFIRLICLICSRHKCLPYSLYSEKDMALEMESLQHGSMREFLRADNQKPPNFVEDTLKSIRDKVEGNERALVELKERIDQRFSEIEALLKGIKHHQVMEGTNMNSIS